MKKSSSSSSSSSDAAPAARDMLDRWNRVDWAAIGVDNDAAVAPPPVAAVVQQEHPYHSLIAQLKAERLRQEERRAAAAAGTASAAPSSTTTTTTTTSNKRPWVDDDSAADVPRQWPQNMRVAYVSGAERMTIFDEWFWLVFIGNHGMYAYERALQGKATRRDHPGCLSSARFLNLHKADVVQQQKDRMRDDDGCERARSRKQFEVMAPAFLRQISAVFTVRAFSCDWCKGNVHVLQWLADHAGAPVALVHRGRGWVAEYLPRASGESAAHKYPAHAAASDETEAATMEHHTWRPASNCIVLYVRYDSEAVGGLVFGVELAPERIAQLIWFPFAVRLRSPYCAMTCVTKYSIESLTLLDKRLADARAAMRKCTTNEILKRVKMEPETVDEDDRPMRKCALFKKIATALTAY